MADTTIAAAPARLSKSRRPTTEVEKPKQKRPAKKKKEVFGPAFDNDAMRRIEDAATTAGIGQARRLALAICACDSDKVHAMAALGDDAFTEAVEAVKGFEQQAAGMHHIAQAAVARLEMVSPAAAPTTAAASAKPGINVIPLFGSHTLIRASDGLTWLFTTPSTKPERLTKRQSMFINAALTAARGK